MTVYFYRNEKWVEEPVNLKNDAEVVGYIKSNVPENGKFKVDRG